MLEAHGKQLLCVKCVTKLQIQLEQHLGIGTERVAGYGWSRTEWAMQEWDLVGLLYLGPHCKIK